jgi:hypothetical protein
MFQLLDMLLLFQTIALLDYGLLGASYRVWASVMQAVTIGADYLAAWTRNPRRNPKSRQLPPPYPS